MKFLCGNCKAKYQIADEKVTGRTLRMKCRRCDHDILIDGHSMPASHPPAATMAPAPRRGGVSVIPGPGVEALALSAAQAAARSRYSCAACPCTHALAAALGAERGLPSPRGGAARSPAALGALRPVARGHSGRARGPHDPRRAGAKSRRWRRHRRLAVLARGHGRLAPARGAT